MNTLSREMTVGELAATQPASVRVFEAHQIDFCCGGKTPLDEACRTRGIDTDALLREIGAAAAGVPEEKDWTSAQAPDLIDHIVGAHHAYLKTELPRLESMLAKIRSKHAARHGAVLDPLAETFGSLKEELESHLMKEERILFPMIRLLAEERQSGSEPAEFHCGSVKNPLRVMFLEHDSAGAALERMRSLTKDYTPPEDACATFRAFYWGLAELERDLHRHIHLENNILFPKAVALESGSTRAYAK